MIPRKRELKMRKLFMSTKSSSKSLNRFTNHRWISKSKYANARSRRINWTEKILLNNKTKCTNMKSNLRIRRRIFCPYFLLKIAKTQRYTT